MKKSIKWLGSLLLATSFILSCSSPTGGGNDNVADDPGTPIPGFEYATQKNGMPIICITANYFATLEVEGY